MKQIKKAVMVAALAAIAVGPVAAAALPDLAGMMKKASKLAQQSREGRTKGNLGAFRAALSIFYGDFEGRYPRNLSVLTKDGKYLRSIPNADTAVAGHTPTKAVIIITGVQTEAELFKKLKDTGGWAYVADPNSPLWGTLVVDCTHADSKGNLWHRY